MKKSTKGILALILSMLLVFSAAMPAFAAENDWRPNVILDDPVVAQDPVLVAEEEEPSMIINDENHKPVTVAEIIGNDPSFNLEKGVTFEALSPENQAIWTERIKLWATCFASVFPDSGVSPSDLYGKTRTEAYNCAESYFKANCGTIAKSLSGAKNLTAVTLTFSGCVSSIAAQLYGGYFNSNYASFTFGGYATPIVMQMLGTLVDLNAAAYGIKAAVFEYLSTADEKGITNEDKIIEYVQSTFGITISKDFLEGILNIYISDNQASIEEYLYNMVTNSGSTRDERISNIQTFIADSFIKILNNVCAGLGDKYASQINEYAQKYSTALCDYYSDDNYTGSALSSGQNLFLVISLIEAAAIVALAVAYYKKNKELKEAKKA